MRQKNNIINTTGYFAISLLLCTCSTVFAQQNHIRKRIPVEAVSPATGASESNSMTTTQYYDVAGREVQTVLQGTTPQGKDLSENLKRINNLHKKHHHHVKGHTFPILLKQLHLIVLTLYQSSFKCLF